MHVVELSLVEPMSLVYSVSDDLWFVIVAPNWCLHSLWGAKKSNGSNACLNVFGRAHEIAQFSV